MKNKGTVSSVKSESVHHLQTVYEQSLVVLSQDSYTLSGNSPKVRLCRAALPLHADALNLQKRALHNAASALATLWKISGSGRAKTQGRIMLPNRQAS
jgi:hypothetical protein